MSAMTRQERNAGLVFLLFGLAVATYSVTALSTGTIKQPGPGLFPLICGGGIVLLCLLWIFRGYSEQICSEPLWEEKQWIRPVIAVIVLLVYTAIMEDLGYPLSTLAFLAAWQRFIENAGWRRTAVISIVGTIAMYILFVYLLSVPLPLGILD